MLTDKEIKNAKGRDKPYKLTDERGLFLLVNQNGSKWWRFRFTYLGKEKMLSLGTYPDVSLSEAREKRDEAKKLVAKGINPSEHRQAEKEHKATLALNSFEAVARAWLAIKQPSWAAAHYERVESRIERDLFPYLGTKPLAMITGKQVIDALKKIVDRGAVETSHRALYDCKQIFVYGIAHGICEQNPALGLEKALPPIPKTKHFAAITDPKKVPDLLRKIDSYRGTQIVRAALKLAPLVFVRPGELRTAKWSDIDFETKEWTYHVSKTDLEGHIVPLSKQAIAILEDIKPISGHGEYVFRGSRNHSRPMSENTINAALRSLDVPSDEMSAHGFRAMARTILHEVHNYDPDWIEKQLSHVEGGSYSGAYNRTQFRTQRHQMMQVWADYLDAIKAGGNVIPLTVAA